MIATAKRLRRNITFSTYTAFSRILMGLVPAVAPTLPAQSATDQKLDEVHTELREIRSMLKSNGKADVTPPVQRATVDIGDAVRLGSADAPMTVGSGIIHRFQCSRRVQVTVLPSIVSAPVDGLFSRTNAPDAFETAFWEVHRRINPGGR
jgi:hypothetical protein